MSVSRPEAVFAVALILAGGCATALAVGGHAAAGIGVGIGAAWAGILWLVASKQKMARALREIEAFARGERGQLAQAVPPALRPLAEAIEKIRARQVELEASLEMARRQMEHLLEEMPVGIILLDEDGRFKLANRQARRLLGVDERGRLPEAIAGIVPGGAVLAGLAKKALQTGVRQDEEVRVGEDRMAQATAFKVGAGDGVWLVLQDITTLRQIEQVRRDFVANAGHEMRTPVAAIRVLAENLLAGAMNDSQMGPRFARDILANTERLEKLVADMLELARLEEGGQPLEAVDVAEAINEAVDNAGPLAASAGVEIKVAVEDSLQALCTRENLLAALVNLLDNAIKYGGEGKRVEVEGRRVGEKIHILVRDYGPGIPPHLRQRVFERFFRVDKMRSRRLGGTGLGLSIVRHAVEQCGGQVWVEETPGGGATFVIALRLARAGE